MTSILSKFRFVNALAPIANAFAGTVYPTGINMSQYGRLAFVIQKGVGTTGTTTVTVVAGSDASPITESAVPFRYRRIAAGDTTIGALTQATATGFATTAGSGDMYIVEVDAKDLAASGFKYAHLKMVESVASAVIGSVLAFALDARYADNDVDIVS